MIRKWNHIWCWLWLDWSIHLYNYTCSRLQGCKLVKVCHHFIMQNSRATYNLLKRVLVGGARRWWRGRMQRKTWESNTWDVSNLNDSSENRLILNEFCKPKLTLTFIDFSESSIFLEFNRVTFWKRETEIFQKESVRLLEQGTFRKEIRIVQIQRRRVFDICKIINFFTVMRSEVKTFLKFGIKFWIRILFSVNVSFDQ